MSWKQASLKQRVMFWLSTTLAVALLISQTALAEMVLPPASDIRLLIDISGSMKKNDPNNLRRPALNLVTELLPAGDNAGVWTFAQYVNELVRHKPVDDEWRRLAREKAPEINSVGLFTNIGAVLEKSSEDLNEGEDYSNTHFILLTDGVVDISQTPGENVAERERILTSVIKRFKNLKAKIHTIALSKNADQNVLKKLSVETDGIAALAETSEELSRIFLQAFERAVPAEEVPIEGNTFDIDSSVEEFTALLFRADETTDTIILEPTGNKFSATDHSEYVKWFKQPGYDLITVKRPLEGEWQLEANLAPDSKVTVVSNLKLVFDPLPGNFYAGEHLQIHAGFFEDGQQIIDPNFLNLLTVDVTVTTKDNKSGTKTISTPGEPPADGVFKEQITRLKKVGVYQVMVQADGQTFKRQARQIISLNPPMAAELEATGEGDDTRYRIVVNALSPNISTEETAVVFKIKAPDGGNLIKAVLYNSENDRWQLDIEPTRGEGIYRVTVRVDGVTQTGANFRFEPDIINAEFPRQEASPNEFRSLVDEEQAAAMNEVLVQETEPKVEPPPLPEPEPEAPAEIPPAPSPEESNPEQETGLSMGMIAAIAGGIAALLTLSGLGFWLLKRKKATNKPTKKPSKEKRKRSLVAEETLAKEAVEADSEEEIGQLGEIGDIDDSDMDFAAEEADDQEFNDLLEIEPEAEAELEMDALELDEPDIPPEPEPEPALEIEEAEDEDDEFNLQDFDISDTDDLQPPEDDKP